MTIKRKGWTVRYVYRVSKGCGEFTVDSPLFHLRCVMTPDNEDDLRKIVKIL